MTNAEAIRILRESRIAYIAPNGKQLSTEALDMAIRALKNEQTRWIPVSERLPEDGIDVLVCNIKGCVYMAHRSSFGGYYDGGLDKTEDEDVLAWMPLPKPYKAESEEEE